jgi:2'-5' RNA ligase
MRCFVAVDVSEEVRAAMARAQAGLRAAAPRADVRWVAPAAFHMTLAFLGEIPDADVPALAHALEPAAARRRAFGLAARGVGGFPSPRRPRVVWAGVSGGVGELAGLAAETQAALVPFGFVPEKRDFRAHVTIGRVRSPRDLAPLAAALEAGAGLELGAWTAGEVVLYRSRLRPTGAVYEAVSRLPLATADP